MPGAIAIALIVVVAGPALVWAGLGLAAYVLGETLWRHAEATHPNSELIETNR
jgi:hypothetical protein